MRRRLNIAIVAVALLIVAIAFTFGRGRVGPESVVEIEVEARIEEAAARAGVEASVATDADPHLLILSPALERKRRVKRVLGVVGLVTPAPETAMQFTLRRPGTLESVRCLVVLRGDHVIGLAVIQDGADDMLASQVQSALEAEFSGYEVQRLRSGV